MSHAASTSPSHFKKVVMMVFENADYEATMKQADFKQMAQNGVLFSNCTAETHPSHGKYIAMIAGSDMGVHSDKAVSLKGIHVGDLLEKAGLQWRVYAERYPGRCFLGTSSGHYARRHNPFISFANVTSNPKRCDNIESADRFDQELKSGS